MTTYTVKTTVTDKGPVGKQLLLEVKRAGKPVVEGKIRIVWCNGQDE